MRLTFNVTTVRIGVDLCIAHERSHSPTIIVGRMRRSSDVRGTSVKRRRPDETCYGG